MSIFGQINKIYLLEGTMTGIGMNSDRAVPFWIERINDSASVCVQFCLTIRA